MGLRLSVCTFWLGVVGSLSGCGSKALTDGTQTTAPPPMPTPEGPTLEEACSVWQTAACTDFQRCAPDTFASFYPDLAACGSVRSADCVERRSAAGNTVTPTELEACAQASSNLACTEVVKNEFRINPARVAACVWKGTLPEGEACITSSQCASGSCSFYERDTCGTCVTRADDVSCLTSAECLLGSVCIDGTCIVAGKAGQACGSGLPCSADLVCQANLCVPLGQAGEPCPVPDYGGCAPNLWCNRQTGNCEHSTLASGLGACGQTAGGSNVLCPAGKVCLPDPVNGNNRCVLAGTEGASCSYELECGVGLDCHESACTKLRADVCAPSTTTPNSTYPAFIPSVPQAVAPSKPSLLTAPKIALVTFAGDPRADALEPYVQALGASEYWHSVTSEYGIGKLVGLPPIRVAETPPSTLTDTDVQTWLADKLANDARFPPNDGLTLYVVAYPQGVSVSFSGAASGTSESCRDFGGYHESFTAAGTVTPYAVIPDCFYSDPESSIAHEAVEAATDPFSGLLSNLGATRGYASVDVPHFAWALPAGGGAELADLCEWQPLSTYWDPEVGGLVVRSWSNAAMAGFHQPCVPARAGSVYFNSVPHFDDTITVVSPIGVARTHGIAIPLGQSRTVPVDLLSDGPMAGPWRVSAYDLKEWTQAFDYRQKTEPTLRFSFDQQSGVNGDTLQMTITAIKQDSDYQAEPFVLVSRRGRDTNLWLGVVGQR